MPWYLHQFEKRSVCIGISFARGRLSGGFIVSWRGGFVIIGAKSMEQLSDNGESCSSTGERIAADEGLPPMRDCRR